MDESLRVAPRLQHEEGRGPNVRALPHFIGNCRKRYPTRRRATVNPAETTPIDSIAIPTTRLAA